MGHQFSHRTLHKCRPDGQCSKIQDHDLPAGGDFHRYVRGGFQLEDHRRGGHVPGSSAAAHTMYRLQGGVDVQVHDGPLQNIAW